jgi:hypothetical protein
MSYLDVDLKGLLTKLLNHELARMKKIGIKSEEALSALKTHNLMPDQIATQSAKYLGDLLAFEFSADQGDNPAFSQPHGDGKLRHPTVRKNGKGWSREYIESRFIECVEDLTKNMVDRLREVSKRSQEDVFMKED